ncbi:hypothetical protein PHPALM_28879, partial [Phytophthora palmivora]
CSKRGERKQGSQALEILLKGFVNALELVAVNTNCDELHNDHVLTAAVQQIFNCLTSLASGQIPIQGCSVGNESTTARYHRDAVANAVLWRFCEPLFRSLLAIETISSKFAVFLQWLDSRRPPFGYTPIIPVRYENAGTQPNSKQVISLWWSDHAPLIPRHTSSSMAENESIRKGYSSEWPMTANYLRCVYETKEIEFKLTSGVSLPKFRLAALQQFFGPTFFDRRVFALHLCSQNVVFEVKRVLERTVRMLKVLGESGTARASRSQHPLIAILCVALAWLVNCIHGGDSATQFWGLVGVDQLIIAHYKANSLPFVKVKDSNMMNEMFRKEQRLTQQDPTTSCKWHVFTSESARSISHQSGNRNCSPFHLLVEEIIYVGSNRAVGLMSTMLMSKTFCKEVDTANVTHDSVYQRELVSSNDYGKVSHATDLARDIIQLNGTINEQVQVIFAVETDEKGVRLSRDQGDIVISGLSLLHSIITRPTLSINDIVDLTAFNSENNAEVVNVLHEIVSWITNLPCGVTRVCGSTLNVLVEIGVALLINFVQSRAYDEVTFTTMNTCVDVRCVLNLIFEPGERNTNVTIDEKQQLWSMLLYFDNHFIASRILETGFLNTAVISRLLSLDVNTHSVDTQINSLNDRLEAIMLVEVLICSASRSGKSVATRMLFTEACKLMVHHDIIMKETAYMRKARDTSSIVRKQVAVCKRVMQLICCLCVDFSSHSPSSVFLSQFELVGVPPWVVSFHQNHLDKFTNSDGLLVRAEQFWTDWQGYEAIETKTTNRAMTRVPTPKNTSEKNNIQTSPQQIRRHNPVWKKPSIKFETMDQDDNSEMKFERPLVSVSPVKIVDAAPKPRQTKQILSSSNITKKNASVIQTCLSIDADSALRLVKNSNQPTRAGSKQPKETTDEEELDSDAYSPFSAVNVSDEDAQRADFKASTKLKSSKYRKSTDAKVDNKLEQDNTPSETNDDSVSDSHSSTVSSRDRPCENRQKPKRGRERVKNYRDRASSPQNEALRGTFRKYDVDGDGAISFIDLRRAMDKQMTGHRISDLDIQRWITEKDRSGQGVVSFEDFVAAFETQVKH